MGHRMYKSMNELKKKMHKWEISPRAENDSYQIEVSWFQGGIFFSVIFF